MDITLEEIIEHGNKWFDTVMGGGSTEEQAAFFLHPDSRIYVIHSGITINFPEHVTLHKQWINEFHKFGEFELIPLNDSPSRVRAIGTVYWQAEYPNRPPPNLIKSVVGEDWILERTPSGELKFVLYINTFHHLLPDSASLSLD